MPESLEDEYREPVIGETRLHEVERDGKTSVEVEIWTGSTWISFEDMIKGKFTGGSKE